MSRTTRIILALTAALLLNTARGFSQSGGVFDLSWSSIDGGGGISEAGIYRLAGAIGQPDAGVPLSGGVFEVSGGFLQDSSYFPVPVTMSAFNLE